LILFFKEFQTSLPAQTPIPSPPPIPERFLIIDLDIRHTLDVYKTRELLNILKDLKNKYSSVFLTISNGQIRNSINTLNGKIVFRVNPTSLNANLRAQFNPFILIWKSNNTQGLPINSASYPASTNPAIRLPNPLLTRVYPNVVGNQWPNHPSIFHIQITGAGQPRWNMVAIDIRGQLPTALAPLVQFPNPGFSQGDIDTWI